MDERFETVWTRDFGDYRLELALAPETEAPDWDFETEEDERETLRRIRSGDLLYFVARVRLVHTAARSAKNWAAPRVVVLGEDFLGGCCYWSVDEFQARGGYFFDMCREAIGEARQTLASLRAA